MPRKTLTENADYACPIVGTCLTVSELRRICRKCGDAVADDASDYEAHVFLVGQAKVAGGGPAKYLQRFLDKKYRRDLRAFLRVEDPATLRRMWRERADAGDVPGPFWALMSHPTAPEELLRDIYGEVHMLSHRVGAANRADLARLSQLEERLAETAAALEESKTVLRQAVSVWKGRCREAMEALSAERVKRQAAERERISLRQAIESSAVAAVRRDRDILRDQLADLAERLEATETEAGRQALALERMHAAWREAKEALADRDSEVEALEATLFAALGDAAAAHAAHAEHHRDEGDDGHPAVLPGGAPCPCREKGLPAESCGEACACRDALAAGGLAGKRVLYVGGRCSLVSHYKVLAERFGCKLLHHDGGREQSAHRLWELLGTADAVVCPVDCVSHEACSLVKQACKGCLKPLILARSSGLSSLARSLAELGQTVQ
ncbi:hypothetical protein DFW101_2203 [Solidesulfovibrio carbinoliphilus subsp. oakridgensis]|uniref:DUF2325 domain-containing protein n=1 Tax=Solidesulfovibrio carbinoliphilus subsp. oakridgensis TaxID=694327 RepID=G7QA58_9BACT|nr:DUF2325 domain-containing protein [Solidesulfovibrio carbinoliphilus]EHJ48209.1 hypothetical protein DFW101_2203 [Solidesulfovibrio carbinoliphilus subsp. oakridgensis]